MWRVVIYGYKLACDHLYGKLVFTWLSLVMALMASFVLSFFPLDVLDEIWDLIGSVPEGFPTYSWLNLGCIQFIFGLKFDTSLKFTKTKQLSV